MKRWFYPDHFFPRDIEKVPAWIRYPESHRQVYQFLCWHSYLIKRSPHRRYTVWTYQQIADHVGLTSRQVGTIMRRLMEDRLIYRWYAGDSGSNTPDGKPRPPRYELPASKGMINWWRRVRKLRRKIFHKREEVNHGKHIQRATGAQRREKEQKKANLGAHPVFDWGGHRARHTKSKL